MIKSQHGVMKRKSCQKHLLKKSKMTGLLDQENLLNLKNQDHKAMLV